MCFSFKFTFTCQPSITTGVSPKICKQDAAIIGEKFKDSKNLIKCWMLRIRNFEQNILTKNRTFTFWKLQNLFYVVTQNLLALRDKRFVVTFFDHSRLSCHRSFSCLALLWLFLIITVFFLRIQSKRASVS